ncbi:MAG: hypothetical protein ACXVCY_16540 [Pseudobdellovibrionaceae bacterium]
MKSAIAISLLSLFVLGACTHGHCKAGNTDKAPAKASAAATQGGNMPDVPSSKVARVKVYKADGSLQCGQGAAISLSDMQKELKGIRVHSSENKNDGLMRIQLCGSPTGNNNVYEIDRKDLEAALSVGFKEWTFE